MKKLPVMTTAEMQFLLTMIRKQLMRIAGKQVDFALVFLDVQLEGSSLEIEEGEVCADMMGEISDSGRLAETLEILAACLRDREAMQDGNTPKH